MSDAAYSIPECEAAVAEADERLGRNHPDAIAARSSLARTLYEAGRYESARDVQTEVVSLSRQVHGTDSQRTIDALHRLGAYLAHAGALSEAIKIEKYVLAVRDKTFGPDSAPAIEAAKNLGVTLHMQGDREALRGVQERLLTSYRLTLGADDEKTLRKALELADTKRVLGDLEGAEELDLEVVRLATAKQGTTHPDTLEARFWLAADLGMQGRIAEFREAAYALLADAREALPAGHALREQIERSATMMESALRRHEEDEDSF